MDTKPDGLVVNSALQRGALETLPELLRWTADAIERGGRVGETKGQYGKRKRGRAAKVAIGTPAGTRSACA